PTSRLLPAGPPRAQIIALQDTLRLQLPVNQSRVTAIGYHSSGTSALALDPIGAQANAGLLKRFVNRFFGDSSSGIRYYQISGGVGPETGGLDVGAPTLTDVYAPVDGSVMAVSDQIVNGKPYGVRIDIQPSGNPGVVVTLTNLKADPALTVGTTVSAGRTKIGRIIDLSSVEQAALARYTQDRGQHVHIEVQAAGAGGSAATASRGARRRLLRRERGERRRRRGADREARGQDPRRGRRRDHAGQSRLAAAGHHPGARAQGPRDPAREPRRAGLRTDRAAGGRRHARRGHQPPGRAFPLAAAEPVPHRGRTRGGGATRGQDRHRRLSRRGDKREGGALAHARRPRDRRDRHPHACADERRE